MTTSTLTLADFLLARIAEDEAAARQPFEFDRPHGPGCSYYLPDHMDRECDCGYPARVLAECEAHRRIVELHKSWPTLVETQPEFTPRFDETDVHSMTFSMSKQMAWMTEQEYRNRFGDEPPTAPMLRALAQPYADHPEFRPEWRD